MDSLGVFLGGEMAFDLESHTLATVLHGRTHHLPGLRYNLPVVKMGNVLFMQQKRQPLIT